MGGLSYRESTVFLTYRTLHVLSFMIIEKRLTVLKTSQNEREFKTILDSEFHAIDSGFKVLGTWDLDSGFQSLVEFRIP